MAGVSNEDFSAITLGTTVIVNGSFTTDSDWSLQTGWSINVGTGKAEHIAPNANMTQDSLTPYRPYKILIDIDANPNGSVILRDKAWGSNITYSSPTTGTQTAWRATIGDAPDTMPIRATNATGTTIVDNVSVQPVSLDDWTLIGDTRTATTYNLIDGDATTVRLVSAIGETIGYEQVVDNGVYKVTPNFTFTTGSMTVDDGGSNTQSVTDNTPFNLTVAGGKIRFFTNSAAAADITCTALNANAYPVAEITAPEDGVTICGCDLTFTGTGTDVEDGAITGADLVWSSDVDGNFATGETYEYVANALTLGAQEITLTATDDDANTGTDVIDITITNSPPVATITSPSHGSSYDTGALVSFIGTGEDFEDGTLTGTSLVWTSSIDGALGTGTSLVDIPLSDGSHVITLIATDSDSATGIDTIIVRVAVDITLRPQTRQGQRIRLAWR